MNSESLFTQVEKDFRIVAVTKRDAECRSDVWNDLRDSVRLSEGMYPGIDAWLHNKVATELGGKIRHAFVGYFDSKPVVSAVVKGGSQAKFCRLSVDDTIQDTNIGEFFFVLMALSIRDQAKDIHFTLPEEVWEEKKGFFYSFAFENAVVCEQQYRNKQLELRCSAPYSDVLRTVLHKLPKLQSALSINGASTGADLLISIKPVHAREICEGRKRVEIRKRFHSKWEGCRMSMYASAPTSGIIGEARIGRVVKSHPQQIWRQFHQEIRCNKGQFDAYVGDSTEVYALVLEEAHMYSNPVSLHKLRGLIDPSLRPPQNYTKLLDGKPWTSAVTISGLLSNSV